MIIQLNNLLSDAALKSLCEVAAKVKFVDGKATANGRAARAKNNEQGEARDPNLLELRKQVMDALNRSEAFNNLALPLRIMPPLLNRYAAGMTYGDHTDRPVMQGVVPLRTDLAMTLFLSEPESYEGGELVISSDVGAQRVKLSAGSMVLYPASTIHRVEPVQSGVRLAVVSWIQSLVRDHTQRMLLAELGSLRGRMEAAGMNESELLRMQKVRGQLTRMWGDV